MEPGYLVLVCAVAALASLLTFFSGFGLGTLLLPVFSLFYPLPAAIVATGLVHFFNGLFKLLLTGRHISFRILLSFGLPAACGAFLGARLMVYAATWKLGYNYELAGYILQITPFKAIIALLMIAFAVIEIIPSSGQWQASPRWMVPGGMLSGFMGGFTGHQGALRNIFLIRLIPTKEAFIATGTAVACMVDLTRLPVYFSQDARWMAFSQPLWFILPVLAAFLGAFAGNRLLKKVTLPMLQRYVAVGIILFAICMGLGII